MPYVQRDWKKRIIAVCYDAYMTDPEWELLPDDHPDFIAYMGGNPVDPTKEELERFGKELARLEDEGLAIKAAVADFNVAFSQLEQALSHLLHDILNVGDSKLAYAIYFSPTSFDARAELVGNAVIQIATEQKRLAELLPHWERITKWMRSVRILRNAIAHSSLLNLQIKGKLYARLSPPASDVIRIGRKLAERQIPGLSAHDIRQGSLKVRRLSDAVVLVSRVVAEFHDGNPSLQRRFLALKNGPMAADSPETKGRSSKRQPRRPPSGGSP